VVNNGAVQNQPGGAGLGEHIQLRQNVATYLPAVPCAAQRRPITPTGWAKANKYDTHGVASPLLAVSTSCCVAWYQLKLSKRHCSQDCSCLD
jgi:hypothetical protein